MTTVPKGRKVKSLTGARQNVWEIGFRVNVFIKGGDGAYEIRLIATDEDD